MHLKRTEVNKRIPIPRKGTKYVVRASGYHNRSVPVLIAVRDMLGLARTAKEVKSMIHQKLLKLNGRPVRNEKESIMLFNTLEADKKYMLSYSPTGKFFFEETKGETRICKIANKTILAGGKIQLTMHDGTNVIDNGKYSINDTVEMSQDGKIKKSISFDKGKEVMIISGKRAGEKGKVKEVSEKKIFVELNGRAVEVDKSRAIAL